MFSHFLMSFFLFTYFLLSFLKVLAVSNAQLAGKYKIGDPVPSDLVVLDSLSSLYENVAFFSDMLLRFPDTVHSLVSKNTTRVELLTRSMKFCNASNIYSKTDRKLLYLVS